MSEPFKLSRLLAFLMVREQVDVAGMGMFSADDVAERMLATPEGKAFDAVVKAAAELRRADPYGDSSYGITGPDDEWAVAYSRLIAAIDTYLALGEKP